MFKFVDSVVNSIIKKKPPKSSQKVKVISRKNGGNSQQPLGKKRRLEETKKQILVSQCEHLITNTQGLRDDEIEHKINKEIEYNAKMLKYLYDNEIEFIMNGDDWIDYGLKGKLICIITSYKINNITNKKFPTLEYALTFRGYYPSIQEYALDEFTPPETMYVSLFANYDDKTIAKKSENSIILKYLEINFIKCSLYHTQKFRNFVAYTNDKALSIASEVNNEIQKQTIQEKTFGTITQKNQKIKYYLNNVKTNDNNPRRMFYFKTISDSDENNIEYFNVCQGSEPATNNQFKFIFNQDYFKKNHYDNNNKFINLNKLKVSDKSINIRKSQYGDNFESIIKEIHNNMKEKTLKVVNEFVEKDTEKTNNKLMFISHNVQNKNGKEPKDEESVEGVGLSNIFRQYSEMLFGQDATSHKDQIREKAFQFTKSMIIVLQETNWLAIDTTIYGMGDVYFVNCDLANGSLFVYGNDNLLYGYNTFRSCKLVKNQKNICKYIDIDAISTTMDLVVRENLKQCKRIYDELKRSYKKTGGGGHNTRTRQKTQGDSTNKRTTPGVSNKVQFKNIRGTIKRTKATKATKAEQQLINETPFINEYLQNLIQDLNEAKQNNIQHFKSLKIKYHSFFNYLENYYDENQTKIDKELLFCVFLHPQFKMKYMNFEKNVFKGSIMVHDLTDWVEKGLTDNEKVFGKLSMNNNQRLFAISCDERMNFTNDLRDNDSRNNKTKQLCTMFSSDFFDPRIQKDETHVVLIGLGVAGPTKNHVAMVIANKTFEEIVINVHLEPSGQGDKADSSEYALAELDALLNSIFGNNIHPFFKKHKATIKNMRIFSDFNLLSNVIAERLKNFKINKGFKEFKFKLLLDRVKTHDNVKKEKNSFHTAELDEKKVNSGCIDNVIYITKVNSIEENIQTVIVGNRKLPSEKYTEEVYNSLSDHSSIIIIEDIDTNIDNMSSSPISDASVDEYDFRTNKSRQPTAMSIASPTKNEQILRKELEKAKTELQKTREEFQTFKQNTKRKNDSSLDLDTKKPTNDESYFLMYPPKGKIGTIPEGSKSVLNSKE